MTDTAERHVSAVVRARDLTAVELSDGVPVAVRGEATDLRALIEKALDKGTSVEAMTKLVDLYERVAARLAAQEFAAALAAFQRACPPIRKRSTARILMKSGGTYQYRYAELDEIAQTVNPLLAPLGLSYTWDSKVEQGGIGCVCTLRHVNGHTVSASFWLPVENPSAMSQQQKHAAALTYARRQSLIQVLGLTTTDPDTDAGDDNPERITEDQVAQLADLLRESGADRAKLLALLGATRLEDVRAVQYASAANMLEQKKRAKARAGATS